MIRPAKVADLLALVAASLVWLTLFHLTGDRRLFFPYSIQFAAQVVCAAPMRPAAAKGGGLIAAFLSIRIWQGASAGVLALELIVAIGATSFVAIAYGPRSRGLGARVLGGVAGSVLAYGGLAF